MRSHNDRFGRGNRTQESWLMSKMGLKEWFYEIDYAPFMFIFLDSMVMEEPASNPKRKQQLAWLKETLLKAKELKRVVILFGHISIGLQTSPFAPILKEYPHIVGGFFGHHHKGGYTLQDGYFHTTIIQGQIETLTNAFAVLELFTDRMELTGFGRVPTRVMKFEKQETRELIAEYFLSSASASSASVVTNNDQESLVKKLVGKVSKKHGYEELVIGGKHQPAASPEEVFPKSEILQLPPPLMLNIPGYRKPLIAAAEPNPGETRFLKKVYSKWPRRVKTLAPEPAVDLSSYHTLNGGGGKKLGKKDSSLENTNSNKGGVWYVIGGKDDPEHKGKIVVSNNQNHKLNMNQNTNNDDDEVAAKKQDEKSKNEVKGKTVIEDEEENDNVAAQNKINDNNDKNKKHSSSQTSSSTSALEDNDRMFVMLETFLVVTSGLVILFLGCRFRRHFSVSGKQ